MENNFKMNVKGDNCAEKPVEEGKWKQQVFHNIW